MSGKSRTELLQWINTTLELNYTKIEQLGSGAAYCQLFDSIYLDVPMAKVKFDASKEYEYLANFKVLQNNFLKHKINKTVPVERLIKCRFQDNLEFVQWVEKFWQDNKDESDYDPNSRRKYMPPAGAAGAGGPSGASTRSSRASSTGPSTLNRRTVSNSSTGSTIIGSNRPPPRTGSRNTSFGSKPPSRISSLNGNGSSSSSNAINTELQNELTITKTKLSDTELALNEASMLADSLESERNFYFNKLREIEILTENTSDFIGDAPIEQHPSLKETLLKIQEILYNTEEGFQLPNGDLEIDQLPVDTDPMNIEEETF
ncbi:Microtubule-associated protein RP/EB family member 1 [Wickerhamomyces ciferrii]|uniref:Microtubule-associated protein RP/EB family member 1 n=1 Tax=Wickerhamomyces ciferrii (strain ATCC 14091 / BCRC 22168 / CBS 111 / JCM 3599 / NBRC 0793 / NRRL Y-1031 F-60-10) TaxID=1206466 RepID=K0KET4_WICCF|nr:Microtubule-associated protein RP/EB family member 1 [Wickerhamomyces ciferrii]CCH40727.1 Microtubule-associated protein RP/EB family member 1 [Wickerhamomyces ciferrii]